MQIQIQCGRQGYTGEDIFLGIPDIIIKISYISSEYMNTKYQELLGNLRLKSNYVLFCIFANPHTQFRKIDIPAYSLCI